MGAMLFEKMGAKLGEEMVSLLVEEMGAKLG
jgi:hypothetical protein